MTDFDFSHFAASLFAALTHHQYTVAIGLALVALVYLLRRFVTARLPQTALGKKFPDVFAFGFTMAVGVLGSVGAALAAGQHVTQPLVMGALSVSFAAAGGFAVGKKALAELWPGLHDVLFPPDPPKPVVGSTVGVALLLIAAGVSLPAPAHACPALTFSHGPAGSLYRLSPDATGTLVSKINFSAGYSYRVNLLPNRDCSVYWLSGVGTVLVGVGQAAIGPGAAFNLTPAIGIGVFNGLLSVQVSYDALSVGGTSSGLFLGRLRAQDFGVLVGTGLNFDFAAFGLGDRKSLPEKPLPAGWVRL